ncbi:hypothetical protein ANO11243_067150 [Dothideomycetidae sp. 11243]|nr:hypothetical protein ANO11243_067150 [fungal sp. No.11243]
MNSVTIIVSEVYNVKHAHQQSDLRRIRLLVEGYPSQIDGNCDIDVSSNPGWIKLLITWQIKYSLRFDVCSITHLHDRLLTHLYLKICGDGTINSLHELPWELLERGNCKWDAAEGWLPISVSRVLQKPHSSRPQSHMRDFNILLLTARSSIGSDVAYCLIGKTVHEIVGRARARGSNVNIGLVRPGTWKSLVAAIKAKPVGFFSLVHFDTHGEVSERKGQNRLGELLGERKVRYLVLNACRTARVTDKPESNFACTLIASGLEVCIAMSYDASVSMAICFLSAFYENLLINNLPIVESASRARTDVRNKTVRMGRFNEPVVLRDDIVPVVYECGTQSTLTITSQAVHSAAGADSHDPYLSADSLGELSSLDLDILKLESILSHDKVILVSGNLGCGQTELANRCADWWLKTKFCTAAIRLRTVSAVRAWLKGQESQEQNAQVAIPADIIGNDPSLQSLIMLEDLDLLCSRSSGLATTTDGPLALIDCQKVIHRVQTSNARDRVLVFTSASLEYTKLAFPSVPRYEMARVSVYEALAMTKVAMKYPDCQNTLRDPLAVSVLHSIVEDSRRNAAFLHFHVPKVVRSNESIHSLYSKVFALGRLLPNSILSISRPMDCFSRFHKDAQRLLVHQPLAYWIILSLTFFRTSFPRDYRWTWMFKLMEKSYLSPKPPRLNFECIEQIWTPTADMPEFSTIPREQNWENAWVHVFTVLSSHGLARTIIRDKPSDDTWDFKSIASCRSHARMGNPKRRDG